MARPAIISDDVLNTLVRIAREQPLDLDHEVTISALAADESMVSKGYTLGQLNSALMLLVRHERICDLGRGRFKVVVPQVPIQGMKIPAVLRELRMSDEGIFYAQMNMLFHPRAFA